jgi:hypothetical protein
VFCSAVHIPASLPVPRNNRIEREQLLAIMGPEDGDDQGAAEQVPEEEPAALGINYPENMPKDNKVEAFADDNSVLSRAKKSCLVAIQTIFIAFSFISGLSCNVGKSVIMFIGNDPAPD